MTIQKNIYFWIGFSNILLQQHTFWNSMPNVWPDHTQACRGQSCYTKKKKYIYTHNNTIDSPFILIKGTCWSERTETSVSDVTIVDRKNKTKKQTTKVILMLHLTHLFLLSNIFSFSCSTNYELCFRPVESEVIKLFLIQLKTDCYAVGVRAAAIDHILRIHQKRKEKLKI